MIKKAFTLIEILVSVVLLGIISLFITSTITQTKDNNKIFEKRIAKDKQQETISTLLYDDIYLSKDISVQSYKKYSILYIKGKNSIYGIEEPFVVWLVLKEKNRLIRIESARKITLPIDDSMKKYIFIDNIQSGCKYFSVNLSKDKKSALVFVQIENKNPVIFEVKKL